MDSQLTFLLNSNEIQTRFKRNSNEIQTKFKRNSNEIQTQPYSRPPQGSDALQGALVATIRDVLAGVSELDYSNLGWADASVKASVLDELFSLCLALRTAGIGLITVQAVRVS